MTPYLLVGLGGALGAIARFAVARLAAAAVATPFPLGTFVINVSGSFLLGVLGTIVAAKVAPGADALRLALGIGFLGSYTTFSTFELETHALVEDGSWLLATLNVGASVVVGFVALRLGVALARAWLP